jgi:MraZ protein
MVVGKYEKFINIDKRLSLPKEFEFYFQNSSAIITKGFDGCLTIRNEKDFELFKNKLLTNSFNKHEIRILIREIFSNTAKCHLDKIQNRVTLPNFLLDIIFPESEYKNEKQEIIILGLIDQIEVWSSKKWKSFQNDFSNSFDKISQFLN